MLLTDGCIADMESLISNTLLPSVSAIVGYNAAGDPVVSDCHEGLCKQGNAWGEHINEPWRILVIVGVYIIVSVGLGMPIFGLLADAVVGIILACGGDLGTPGRFTFSPRIPSLMYNQPIAWTLIGLALQISDALFFVYLAKIFTWVGRGITGRPMWARMGKRTIVVVDTPAVHQLTEAFVSKLYAQAYSFCSVDVHGASGLDHFVHRFTHRSNEQQLFVQHLYYI
jgi:hypothetical protein